MPVDTDGQLDWVCRPQRRLRIRSRTRLPWSGCTRSLVTEGI